MNYSRLAQPDKANPYLEKFIAGPQNETTTPWLPLSYYMLANNNYLILDKQITRSKMKKPAMPWPSSTASPTRPKPAPGSSRTWSKPSSSNPILRMPLSNSATIIFSARILTTH